MKCSRKNCDNKAMGWVRYESNKVKKQVNRCEFHQADYLEKRQTRIEQSMSGAKIKEGIQKHNRIKDIPVIRQPQIQHSHGSRLIKNIQARLDEAFS